MNHKNYLKYFKNRGNPRIRRSLACLSETAMMGKVNVIPPLLRERCRFQPSVTSSLLMLKKDYLTLVPDREDCRQGDREVRKGLQRGRPHVTCRI